MNIQNHQCCTVQIIILGIKTKWILITKLKFTNVNLVEFISYNFETVLAKWLQWINLANDLFLEILKCLKCWKVYFMLLYDSFIAILNLRRNVQHYEFILKVHIIRKLSFWKINILIPSSILGKSILNIRYILPIFPTTSHYESNDLH